MAPTDEVVLDVRDLVKHFALTQGVVLRRTIGAVQAVDGVSFELHRGETLGLVGESGCGKSTVAKLLMGLEKPTSGQAFYNGQDIFTLDAGAKRKLRRQIQLVMQDPYSSLNPRMTVADIVGEPFEILRPARRAFSSATATTALSIKTGCSYSPIGCAPTASTQRSTSTKRCRPKAGPPGATR